MSVLVVIDLRAKPEMTEGVRIRLQEGLREIRAFDGCEDAMLHVNQEEVENILLIEHWASRAHFEQYRSWRAERGDHDRLLSMLAEPLMARVFDIVG